MKSVVVLVSLLMTTVANADLLSVTCEDGKTKIEISNDEDFGQSGVTLPEYDEDNAKYGWRMWVNDNLVVGATVDASNATQIVVTKRIAKQANAPGKQFKFTFKNQDEGSVEVFEIGGFAGRVKLKKLTCEVSTS